MNDQTAAPLLGALLAITLFAFPTFLVWWRNKGKISFIQAHQRYTAYLMMALGALALIYGIILIGLALFYIVKFHALPEEPKDLLLAAMFMLSMGWFGLYSGFRIRKKTLTD